MTSQLEILSTRQRCSQLLMIKFNEQNVIEEFIENVNVIHKRHKRTAQSVASVQQQSKGFTLNVECSIANMNGWWFLPLESIVPSIFVRLFILFSTIWLADLSFEAAANVPSRGSTGTRESFPEHGRCH